MQITLNGKPQILDKQTTVLELLASIKHAQSQIAVELNKEILPKSLYGKTYLKTGDELEIVSFIGGG